MASSTMTWVNLFDNQDITRDSVITNFRTMIDEDTEDVISDSQIASLITNALLSIHRKTWINVGYATDTTDGSDYYELPSGMTKVELAIYTNTSGVNTQLIDSNEVMREDVSTSSTTAKYYERRGNRIYLFGNPTTGTLKVWGAKIPTMPTVGSSYIDIPYQYVDVLYAYLEWQYWKRRRVPDEAQLARVSYYDLAEEVREDLSEQFSKGAVVHG